LGLIAQHTQKFNFLNSKLIAGASIDYSPNDYWSYQIDLAAKLRADGKSVEKYTITKERPDIKIADYNAKSIIQRLTYNMILNQFKNCMYQLVCVMTI
jgi:hypothetical protein